MEQKIIKVGSSLAVTIPKKKASELGVGAGDKIRVNYEAVEKDIKQEKLMKDYDKFVQEYGLTLKNLASR